LVCQYFARCYVSLRGGREVYIVAIPKGYSRVEKGLIRRGDIVAHEGYGIQEAWLLVGCMIGDECPGWTVYRKRKSS